MNRVVTSQKGELILLFVLMPMDGSGSGETVITVTEAAGELGVKRQSVLRFVKDEQLVPAVWWDGKMLFYESEVRALKARRGTAAQSSEHPLQEAHG